MTTDASHPESKNHFSSPLESDEMSFISWFTHLDITNPIALDVGAFHGDYTAQLLSQGKNLSVHLFEPTPENCERCRQRFKHTTAVTCNLIALHDRTGKSDFYALDGRFGSGSSLHHRADVYRDKPYHIISVPTDCLDRYAETAGLSRIHLLKVDTEGNEFAVLRGSRNLLLHQSIDILQFEYGGTWMDADVTLTDAIAFLRSLGYVTMRFQGSTRRFVQVSETNDGLFRNLYAIPISRLSRP